MMSSRATGAVERRGALRRFIAVVVAVLVSAAITACGEASGPNADEATKARGTVAERPSAPNADEAPAAVETLAERTHELRNSVRRTAHELAKDRAAREKTMEDLRAQESEAQELVDRIRRRLPTESPGRDALARANERTAAAASRLERFARSGDRKALEEARAALEESQGGADAALEQLGDRISPDTRDRLEDLRRKAPDIPEL